METGHPRRHPPKHAPHPHIVRLRAAGWLPHQIAAYVGASHRAVSRWAAGDTRPLPVYEEALESLLGTSPAKFVRLHETPEGEPVRQAPACVTLDEYVDSHDITVYRLEPKTIYDPAIVGIIETADGHAVVYDYEKVIQQTMQAEGWDRQDAMEWHSNNHPACEGMPVFMVWRTT